MRNDFKKYSWTLWLVIFVFVGGFVLIDGFRGGSSVKDSLIYIGDSSVKGGEYQDQLFTTLRNYKERFKENFNKQLINQLRVPEQVLQNVINTTIIRSESEKLGISASDEELREKIVNYPAFQVDGKFIGTKEYKLRLSYAKIMPTKFENGLKEEIVLEKFRELITLGLVIDNDTLKENFKKEKDNVELDYILLKPNTVTDKIEVSDSEISDYYEKNKEDFKSAEKRAGNVIALKFEDYKSEVSIDINDMRSYYSTNKAQYADPGKTKVSRILLKYNETNRDEIEKKATALQKELNKDNFAQKAREVSEDEKAQQGGDYGYFEWQRFTNQEKTIIKSLDPFEVSSPVNTNTGFALLLVSEKVEERQKTLDEVADLIRDTIEKQKLEEVVTNKLTAIYKKVQGAPNIKDESLKLNVPVIGTELLAGGDAIKDVDDSGFISRQLFQLKQNEVGSPVKFAKGMAIVQCLQIDEPKVEPLENVKDNVKVKAIDAKKLVLLMERSKKIAAELNAMTDAKKIEQYLKDKNLSASNLAYKRGNKLSYLPQKEGLDDLIFSMPENKYSDPIDLKTELAIVKVKSKKVTGPADFEGEKAAFYTQKMNEAKNSYFTSYITNMREVYDVRINQELYQKIKDDVLRRFN